MKQRKSDILWKVVMEEVFDDLLRFIFPDADEIYDLERGFEFLEKELAEMYPEPDKKRDTRHADKLVKVFNREGLEEWVLCHIEVQGETKKEDRPSFADRMFRYFIRIWDRYQKPVSAVAIFSGPDGKKLPSRFQYEYRKTRLQYEYHTISVLDFADEELEKSNNPFAQVVIATRMSLMEGKIPELDLLDRKVLIANKLLRAGFTQRKIRAILIFLESYVLFEDPEMNRIFIERIQPQDKNNIMGIDEYVKMVAKEDTSRRFVENLLKGSDFSVEKIASLADVTVDFVNEIKNELKAK